MTNHYRVIPEDVIIEILLRLPVKSLSRFRCVCKQWEALITSVDFISNQFQHQSNNDRLLALHYKPDREDFVLTLFTDETFSVSEEPEHLQLPATASYIVGPLIGVFIVITDWLSLALWNPATREFRPLPDSRPDIPPHYSCCDNALGLGLEPISNDFKVVWIRYFSGLDIETGEDDFYDPAIISVYNFGSDSWRHFECATLLDLSVEVMSPSLCNTYLNGVYYWKKREGQGYSVLAFDMFVEVFKEIQLPDCERVKDAELTLYSDSVALLCFDFQEVEKLFEIWVMEEEGYWRKHMSFGPLLDILCPRGFYNSKILFLETKSWEVIVHDPEKQDQATFNLLAKGSGPDSDMFQLFYYRESLGSIKRQKECEESAHNSLNIVEAFFKPSPDYY